MIQRIVRKALWGLFFCFLRIFCPYLDIRIPKTFGKRVISITFIHGSAEIIWTTREKPRFRAGFARLDPFHLNLFLLVMVRYG